MLGSHLRIQILVVNRSHLGKFCFPLEKEKGEFSNNVLSEGVELGLDLQWTVQVQTGSHEET